MLIQKSQSVRTEISPILIEHFLTYVQGIVLVM